MIMIVTPDGKFRREISRYFKERKYELVIPNHRQDVIDLVKKHQPHVIILDLCIADPNGPTLLKNMRLQGCSGKIIVISSVSNRPVIGEVHKHHIDQVVSRSPTDPIMLLLDQIESTIRLLFRELISRKAYEHYLNRSCSHGNDWEDWFKAEREILKGHSLRHP
jgi:DNA-binding NarL/FixJ family response regulator